MPTHARWSLFLPVLGFATLAHAGPSPKKQVNCNQVDVDDVIVQATRALDEHHFADCAKLFKQAFDCFPNARPFDDREKLRKNQLQCKQQQPPSHKPPPAPPAVSLRRLPNTTAQLVGRDNELKQLDDAWASQGRIRIVPIVAMGGLGKTTLVVSWLDRLRAKGWPGARRVFAYSFFSQGSDQRHVTSADSFFAEALRFFGDPHETHKNLFTAADHLRDILRNERSILIIDGLEPLQYPPGPQEGELKDRALAGLLEDLAVQGQGLVIITSREKVTDIARYENDAVHPIALQRHSREAGIQILRGLGVLGTDAELGEAVEGVDGHALALTLLSNLLVEQYGADVRRHREIPSLLGADARGDRAMRAMAAYDQWLSGPERALLRLLGLFDRPAPGAALEALRRPAFPGLNDELASLPEPAWNQMLARLRKVSLLGPPASDDPARLDAHPLVREFFGGRLKAESEAAWKEGHRRLYRWYAAEAPHRPDTIGVMEPLYAAVIHGCRAGMYKETLAEVYWQRIDRGDEGFSTAKLGAFGADLSALAGFFEEPWTRPVTALDAADQMFVLNDAGFVLRALGRLPEAVAPIRASLDVSLAIKDWQEAAIRAANLSEVYLTLGQLPEAIETARQSVELADRSGDPSERSINRTTLADALHQAGQLDEAARLFVEAERLQKEKRSAFPFLSSVQGYRYCDLLLSRGEVEAARRQTEQTIQIARRNNWPLDMGLDHISLARAHLALHPNAPQTRTHFDKAVAHLRESGQQDDLPLGLIHRAAFHRQLHEFAAATGDLDEALHLATRGHMRLHEADARLERARLLLAEKKPQEARAELNRARTMIDEMGYGRRKPEVAELGRQLPAIH